MCKYLFEILLYLLLGKYPGVGLLDHWLVLFLIFEEPPYIFFFCSGFPGGSEVKASACNAGDLGSIPGLGRSPGEGNGNPFQYSCLENPMDRRAWWATVHRVAELDTTERLHFHFSLALASFYNSTNSG